jgi:hypothetical protein
VLVIHSLSVMKLFAAASTQPLEGKEGASFTHMESNLRKFLGTQELGKMIVISAHLWLEHLLLQSLRAVIPNAGALFRDRSVSFPLLISLCEAHEVIEAPLADVLRRVNALRNKCAHQSSFNPNDSDWNALRASLDPFKHTPGMTGLVSDMKEWDEEPLHAVAALLEFRAKAVGATDVDAL